MLNSIVVEVKAGEQNADSGEGAEIAGAELVELRDGAAGYPRLPPFR